MSTWKELFEQVIVPCTGLILIVLAAIGGPVPASLYPILIGLVGYPVVRVADKARREKSE